MGLAKFGITKAPTYGKAVASWFKKKLGKTSKTVTGLQHPVIDHIKINKNLTRKK